MKLCSEDNNDVIGADGDGDVDDREKKHSDGDNDDFG